MKTIYLHSNSKRNQKGNRLVAFFEGGEEVYVVAHTDDLIDRIFVHGQARIVVFEEYGFDFFYCHISRHGYDDDTRHENVGNFAVVKLDRAGYKFSFLRVERAFIFDPTNLMFL